MTGAESALERLAIKAERIALAQAETLARQRENRSGWIDADRLPPVANHT